MSDLRATLQAAAATPANAFDADAVLARGRQLTRNRRVLRSLPAVLIVVSLVATTAWTNGGGTPQEVDTIERPGRPAPEPSPAEDALTPQPNPQDSWLSSDASPQHEGVIAAGGRVPTVASGFPAGSPDTGPGAVVVSRPVVFSSNRDGNWEIYAIGGDGSGLVRLTDHPAADRQPAWSPDGSRVAFTRDHGDGNLDIYVMNADGTGVTRLTDAPGEDISPAWSPDGRLIAFTSDRTGQATEVITYSGQWKTIRTRELYLMDANGNEQRRLLPPSDLDHGHPTWSPDGRHVAYELYDWDAVSGSIWIAAVDGSGGTKVYGDDGFHREPAWSPDGARIAFRADRGASSQVYVVNVDGSGHRQLTNERAAAFLPAWSSDGSRVLFSRDVDGPRYHVSDSAAMMECAAAGRGVDNPADVCPAGPAPSELWTIAVDGTGASLLFGELADAVDADA